MLFSVLLSFLAFQGAICATFINGVPTVDLIDDPLPSLQPAFHQPKFFFPSYDDFDFSNWFQGGDLSSRSKPQQEDVSEKREKALLEVARCIVENGGPSCKGALAKADSLFQNKHPNAATNPNSQTPPPSPSGELSTSPTPSSTTTTEKSA